MAVQITVSPVGAVVGAIAGAAIRPAILFACIGGPLKPEDQQLVLTISAGIGFCVGGLSGMAGHPLLSAFIGTALAFISYSVTVLPLMFCLCLSSGELKQGGDGLTSIAVMALSGTLSGAVGGLAELLVGRRRPEAVSRKSSVSPSPAPPEATLQPADPDRGHSPQPPIILEADDQDVPPRPQ